MIRAIHAIVAVPFAWALIGMVYTYRAIIRPLLPPLCRFEPSCSEYFIQAVKKYGPLSGACRGAWRICRCGPWCKGGHDPV